MEVKKSNKVQFYRISESFVRNLSFNWFSAVRVSVAVCGLSLVVVSGGSSPVVMRGFSLWGLLLLGSVVSRAHGLQSLLHVGLSCSSRGPELKLSRCVQGDPTSPS